MNDASRHLKTLFIKDMRLLLAVMLTLWVWTLLYTLLVHKNQYAAIATVMIRDSAITNRYVEETMVDTYRTTSSEATNPVLNTMGLLQANAIADNLFQYLRQTHPKVLQSMGLRTPLEWQRFFGEGESFIGSKHEPGTDLIYLQLTWPDPVIAKEALQNVLSSFRQVSLDLNRSEQRDRTEYLGQRVQELAQELAKVRALKGQYKAQTGTANVNQKTIEIERARLEVETLLGQAQAEAAANRSGLQHYQAMVGLNAKQALQATAIGQNETLQAMYDRLYTQMETEAQLAALLTPQNPKLREARAKIAQSEADIALEVRRTAGEGASADNAVTDLTRGTVIQQMAQTQAAAMMAEMRAKTLQRHLDQLNGQIRALPLVESKTAQLDQQEKSLSEALANLERRYLESEMKEAEAVSNVFVVDEPRIPLKPLFPSASQVLFLGFLGGIAASGGLFVWRNRQSLAELYPGKRSFTYAPQ